MNLCGYYDSVSTNFPVGLHRIVLPDVKSPSAERSISHSSYSDLISMEAELAQPTATHSSNKLCSVLLKLTVPTSVASTCSILYQSACYTHNKKIHMQFSYTNNTR